MLSFVLACGIVSGALAWFPDEYPDYCSRDMSDREIPPLTPFEKSQIGQLMQVQVVIRHGARTPFMKYSCWKDYHIPWDNCNITELMYTSSSKSNSISNFLFRKVYDGSLNFLGGTCQTGQLLEEGYAQESFNGGMLRRAYIGFNKEHLLESHRWDSNDHNKFYFRSDDEQRTLMSGQSLVYSLFEVESHEVINWHTGDYQLDTIYPNSFVCPRLDNISSDAFTSVGYLTSPIQLEKKQLEEELDVIFGEGYWHWKYMTDCLMTSVCSGRDIPGGDDVASSTSTSATRSTSTSSSTSTSTSSSTTSSTSASTSTSTSTNIHTSAIRSHTSDVVAKRMTNELFKKLLAYQEFEYFYKYTFQDALYSKLAMSKLVYNLRSRIEAVMRGDEDSKQFVLYAGHDTTLMPLLALLPIADGGWDGKWAPYAALLSLELYSANNDNNNNNYNGKFIFRLVYNGTPLVLTGCSTALCDVTVLLEALAFGQATVPDGCRPVPTNDSSYPSSPSSVSDITPHCSPTSSSSSSSSSWSVLAIPVLLTALVSCSCSAGLTWWYFVSGRGGLFGSKYTMIDSSVGGFNDL